MKAIILAAGRGSRMKSMTDEQPKCLSQLHGKALLDWQIESIKGAGIDEIAIVTGYRREMLLDRGLVEFHNSRWAQTNMLSSLACADDWLQNESCLISYSDIFYESQAVKLLIQTLKPLAITYDPNWLELWNDRFGDALLDAETFRLNSDSNLKEIGNKPQTVEEVEGQYMGLLRFEPRGWAEIQRIRATLPAVELDQLHMTGILQKIIDAGRLPVKAVSYQELWGEVDSESDLQFYNTKSNS